MLTARSSAQCSPAPAHVVHAVPGVMAGRRRQGRGSAAQSRLAAESKRQGSDPDSGTHAPHHRGDGQSQRSVIAQAAFWFPVAGIAVVIACAAVFLPMFLARHTVVDRLHSSATRGDLPEVRRVLQESGVEEALKHPYSSEARGASPLWSALHSVVDARRRKRNQDKLRHLPFPTVRDSWQPTCVFPCA